MLRLEIRPFFRRERQAHAAAKELVALNPLVQTDWDSRQTVVSVRAPKRRTGNFLRTLRANHGRHCWYLVDLEPGAPVTSGVIQPDPEIYEVMSRGIWA